MTMAGQDRCGLVDQYRVRPDALDAPHQAGDLGFWMPPRTARKAPQLADRPPDDSLRQTARLVDRPTTPRQRRPAQLALQVGLSCPAGSVAHALWIGAIRHGHVIPSDRTSRIYKVTFGESAHAGAPTGRADRRLRQLALLNGRLEPGGLAVEQRRPPTLLPPITEERSRGPRSSPIVASRVSFNTFDLMSAHGLD